MTSRKRKRVSPRDEFTRFCDAAAEHGWDVMVFRWTHDDQVLLKVRAIRGASELAAPSVTDITELAASVKGLREQLEREAA